MKSVHHDFLTKKDGEKLVSITTKTAYTKDDFLTPSKVAKKLGISTETVKTIMKNLIFKRAAFSLNSRKAQIVVKMGKNDSMYVHPLGFEAFKKHLDTQKD
jgi:hypothetical protein